VGIDRDHRALNLIFPLAVERVRLALDRIGTARHRAIGCLLRHGIEGRMDDDVPRLDLPGVKHGIDERAHRRERRRLVRCEPLPLGLCDAQWLLARATSTRLRDIPLAHHQ
jgi:hypothetical protein